MSSNNPSPSDYRRTLAAEFAATLSLPVDAEVVLTGSVARSVADVYSDIELRVLVPVLPSPTACEEQLRAAGLTVDPATSVWNGMVTTKSWFRGVFVEAAWQTFEGLAGTLQPVVAVETTDHWALVEAWHIVHAVPLTSAPTLALWQEQLAHYPPSLQTQLIARSIATWGQPHWYPLSPANLWPVAARGSELALAGKLIQEVERALRLVFAVNQMWEPDYKWLADEQRRLTAAPDNLVGQTNAIFSAPEPVDRVQRCLDLIDAALALVPPAFDVQLQRERISEVRHPERLLQSRG